MHMAHFYGTLQGNRGKATRMGTRKSGIETYAAGWGGAIRVTVFEDEDSKQDCFEVSLVPWQSSGGDSQVLARGELSAKRLRVLKQTDLTPVKA
jgi:hypothetical protein